MTPPDAPGAYSGATEPISGTRALLYVNGAGPPVVVRRFEAVPVQVDRFAAPRLAPAPWDDAELAGELIAHHLAQHHPHLVRELLGAVRAEHGTPQAEARFHRAVLTGADLAADSWSVPVPVVGAALASVVDATLAKRAAVAEQQRIAETRRRPAELRRALRSVRSRHADNRARIDAIRDEAARLKSENREFDSRAAGLEAEIRTADESAAKLPPAVVPPTGRTAGDFDRSHPLSPEGQARAAARGVPSREPHRVSIGGPHRVPERREPVAAQ